MGETAIFNAVFAASFAGCLVAIGVALLLRKAASYARDEDIPVWLYFAFAGIGAVVLIALFDSMRLGASVLPFLQQ